jgi:hypothetical protein
LPLGAIFGGVLALGAALSALWLWLGLPRPLCHFREWTGIPCPTCGSTRLADAVLSGKLVEAFLWNPLVFLSLTAVAGWALLSIALWLFDLPAWRLNLEPRERVAARLLAMAAIVAGWGWVIWRGM